MRPIHLKWSWSETAHDEVAVAVSRTVQVTLLGRSQIVTRNYNPVRVWVGIEVHELRFFECRFYGVVSGRFVGRIPVSHRRTGDDVEGIAFLGELRAVECHPRGLFFGVDFPRPAQNGHSATSNAAGSLHRSILREGRCWN